MIDALGWSRPAVLIALLLLPAYGLLRRRLLRRDAVAFPPLQYRPGWRLRGRAARLLIPAELMLLVLLLLGLAGPYERSRLELLEEEGIDVVLVLDVSLSMLAEDFPPNRLAALRRIARDFITRSGGNRTGVVIFAKDSFVQSPLTPDHKVLLDLLDGVSANAIDQRLSGGTAVGDALLVAADLLERERVEGRDQAAILITDGESNSGVEPSLAGRYLRQLGVRLYAIGVGGEETVEVEVAGRETPILSRLDEDQLRNLVAVSQGRVGAGGGQSAVGAPGGKARYFRAAEVGALEEIFAGLSRLESAPLELRRLEVRRPFAARLALAALPLFAATLLLAGVVRRTPLR